MTTESSARDTAWRRACILLALGIAFAVPAWAGDWPQWRYDAQHTAASPDSLPTTLYLQWVAELGYPAPAWPTTQGKLQFDAAYEPVVADKRVFVPSSRHDCLTALDTETGAELWRYYADGPVRVPPATANGRVYFAADDGHLHCVAADTGALVWKFRGAPADRKILGNERIIASWPARGGPVIRDGVVYFTASIWPFLGIFIYALDADTGAVIWSNSGDGARWSNQQHPGALSFATVSPQGSLCATNTQLLLTGGRTVPAAFDRATGAFQYFRVDDRTWDKDQGGYAVAVLRDWFFSGPGPAGGHTPGMYRLSDGGAVRETNAAVLTDNVVYEASGGRLYARDAAGASPTFAEIWNLLPSGPVSAVYCRVGSYLYAGGPAYVVAVEDLGASGVERWSKTIVGTPRTMLAADDKLFVGTTEGYLYCFGVLDSGASMPGGGDLPVLWPPEDAWTTEAENIVAETGVGEGYCVVLGAGTGRLAEELARQSLLHVLVIEPSVTTVKTLRDRWRAMHVPGELLSILAGDICTAHLPPYLASVAASEDPAAAENGHGTAFAEALFASLRPYGGVACFPASVQATFADAVSTGRLVNAETGLSGSHALLRRVGSLPGAAPWTHQYADTANSVTSKDTLVRAPLGVLWFGGSDNTPILPRHGHGPSEQVIGGRLFIEGVDLLRAMDVYTGRVLWERSLPGLGTAYNNTSHMPGANHINSNYASASDGVYVAYGSQCLWLNPQDGQTLPPSPFAVTGNPTIAHVKVWQDRLLVAASPEIYDAGPIGQNNWNATGSRELHVLNRHTGVEAWSKTALHTFHHNTIIVANGILYCIDRFPPGYEKALERRGIYAKDVADYTLWALDVQTGNEVWSTTENTFGTWLGYSEDRDILIQAGRPSRDMVTNEPFGRMIAYNGKTGAVLWDKALTILEQGPYLIHRDRIIAQGDVTGGSAYDLLTGNMISRRHPVTDTPIPWAFTRTYGCNTAIACENLLTFRSGAAGFFDLKTDGGTGNFGGFKSGCTSNLIAADGVLSAPDYTRTCTCSYQNQTSLAMIPMPEAEMWTYGAAASDTYPVRQVGINLGAPGDRVAENGVLWVDYPSVGYTSPAVTVYTTPTTPTWFRNHAATLAPHPMAWVAASGAKGLTGLDLGLANTEEEQYIVRCYFAEPDTIAAGQRVFSVALQGTSVLTDFDVVATAGAPRTSVVREFRNVAATSALSLTLTPNPTSPIQQSILCGIEVLVDDDGDELASIEERNMGLNPDAADTDGDGVRDRAEIYYDGDPSYNPYDTFDNPSGTDLNATRADTDDDGVTDGAELVFGYDPLDPARFPVLPGPAPFLLMVVLLAGFACLTRKR